MSAFSLAAIDPANISLDQVDFSALIPFDDVPEKVEKLCPPMGRIHRQSGWRWAATGVAGKKLPTIQINKRVYTTEVDLKAFIEHLITARGTRYSTAGKHKKRQNTARRKVRKLAKSKS